MRRQIVLGEVLDATRFAANAAHYRCWPGIVQAYHAPSQGQPATVDVEVAVDDPRIDPTSGEVVMEKWPIIPNVRLGWPKLGGYALWGPAKAGDAVVLLAFDMDVSTFQATGARSEPVMLRRNAGLHWIALPFDITDAGALPDPGNQICVGKPGGAIVAFDGSHVNLGAAAPTDAVALASLVKTELTEIKTALASLTCPNSGTGSPVPVVASTPYTGPANIASGTVKCQP